MFFLISTSSRFLKEKNNNNNRPSHLHFHSKENLGKTLFFFRL